LVLAQGLEYLAHLKAEWNAKRVISERTAFWEQQGKQFTDEADRRLGAPVDDELLQRIDANLLNGRLPLVIASDRIPETLRATIEFLQTSATFDVYGLELGLFEDDAGLYRILAPRMVGPAGRDSIAKPRPSTGVWTMERFITALEEARPTEEVAVARELKEFAEVLTQRTVRWGSGRERGSFTARACCRQGRGESLLRLHNGPFFDECRPEHRESEQA
jgi:hypothetical protein